MNDETDDTGDGVSHLDASTLALYIDRRAAADLAASIERHLSACPSCRADWIAAQDALYRRIQPSARILVPLAAAAALALVVWSRVPGPSEHREPVILTSQAPVTIAPSGPVASAPEVVWSLVPGADRYRVAVFDSAGHVLWETSTPDTAVVLPATVTLTPGVPHFWRVHARTGFDRWVESSLVEFRIAKP